MLLFPMLQAVRLSAGSAGSRSEQLGPLLLMLGLSAPVIAFFVYFLFYQVYVCVPPLLPPPACAALACEAGFDVFACLHSSLHISALQRRSSLCRSGKLNSRLLRCSLRIDQILCGIGMAFVLLQVATGIAPLYSLLRSPLR